MNEETLTIETPEHVELQFALASIGNRFLACAIDHLIQIMAVVLIGIVVLLLDDLFGIFGGRFMRTGHEIGKWFNAFGIILLFLILFGYFIFFETIWSGQTPGKRWLRLRVISYDGRPVTFFAAMTRNLLRLADMIVPPFYSIGLLSVFATRHSRRLGDFVANTVVIKERDFEAPSFDSLFSAGMGPVGLPSGHPRIVPPVAFDGDLSVIEAVEILPVEMFLRRSRDLPGAPREWLAWRIAAPLLEKLRPTFDPQHFTYEGFLEELLARYREINRYGGKQ